MQYRACVREFFDWCEKVSAPKETDAEVDGALVRWMNAKYLLGHQASLGEKVFAGIMCLMPEFSRMGARCLPRSARCLKRWRKLCPSHSRRPLPWAAWCGIAAEMAREKQYLAACMCLVSVDAYLRPSEAVNLTCGSLMPPSAQGVNAWVLRLFPQEEAARSKVGESDDTISMDSPRLRWLAPVFAQIAKRDKEQKAFGMDYAQYLEIFSRAVSRMGLKAVPYQARHSGPSIDRAQGARTQAECQKRGRWRSMKSLQRYEKHGRLNESWRDIGHEAQLFGRQCEAAIEKIVLHGAAVPAIAT